MSTCNYLTCGHLTAQEEYEHKKNMSTRMILNTSEYIFQYHHLFGIIPSIHLSIANKALSYIFTHVHTIKCYNWPLMNWLIVDIQDLYSEVLIDDWLPDSHVHYYKSNTKHHNHKAHNLYTQWKIHIYMYTLNMYVNIPELAVHNNILKISLHMYICHA